MSRKQQIRRMAEQIEANAIPPEAPGLYAMIVRNRIRPRSILRAMERREAKRKALTRWSELAKARRAPVPSITGLGLTRDEARKNGGKRPAKV